MLRWNSLSSQEQQLLIKAESYSLMLEYPKYWVEQGYLEVVSVTDGKHNEYGVTDKGYQAFYQTAKKSILKRFWKEETKWQVERLTNLLASKAKVDLFSFADVKESLC
jgi:hypothetical protein